MGNIYSRKCYKCSLGVGDYGVNYICYLIGKGKYNGRYICCKCYYDQVSSEIYKKKESNKDMLIEYDDLNISNQSFEELR